MCLRARWAHAAFVCLLAGSLLRAETAILQIRVLHGEGGVYPAGTRPPQGVAVSVTDETGAPVEGVRVSFVLPDEGPSGMFAPGLRTAVAITGSDGKAAAPSPMLGEESGPLRVRVVARKDEARAGCVVNQFIAVSARAQTAVTVREVPPPAASRGGRGKVFLILGAAAAGGLALGLTRQGGPAAPAVAAGAVTRSGPRIGTPIITVGRP